MHTLRFVYRSKPCCNYDFIMFNFSALVQSIQTLHTQAITLIEWWTRLIRGWRMWPARLISCQIQRWHTALLPFTASVWVTVAWRLEGYKRDRIAHSHVKPCHTQCWNTRRPAPSTNEISMSFSKYIFHPSFRALCFSFFHFPWPNPHTAMKIKLWEAIL